MIREEQDSIVTISQKPRGGTGEITGKQLLTEADMQNNLNGLYINYLDVDSEIGYHEHHNEDEVYYILEGTGIANDNGKDSLIEAQISAQQFQEMNLKEGEVLVVTPRRARVFVDEGALI